MEININKFVYKMRVAIYYIGFLLIFNTIRIESFIAYQCDNSTSSVMSLSLVDTEPCSKLQTNSTVTSVNIKVVQPKLVGQTNAISCLIEIEHSIFMCGKSWEWNYAESKYEEYFSLSKQECYQLISQGRFKYNGMVIDVNTKSSSSGFSVLTFGTETTPGYCESDSTLIVNGRSYPRAMRDSFFKIKTNKFKASIDFEDNKINLYDGSTCKYTNLECISSDIGNVFWDDVFNPPECKTKRYTVIFEGEAKKNIELDMDGNVSEVSYSFNLNGYLFRLWIDQGIKNSLRNQICTYKALPTIHPKIVIIEESMHGYKYFDSKKLESTDIDIFSYINSKLVYSMNIVKDKVEDLYNQLKYDKCLTDKKLAASYLTTAYTSPLEFAFQYFDGPGYSATIMGEVIYVFKCNPVTVSYANTPGRCFKELPVKFNNNIFYLTPRTKVLIPVGTEVDCTSILPTMHKINGEWYTTNGMLVKTQPPTVIKNNENTIDWKFDDINSLAESGIYTEEDLNNYQLNILNPLSHNVITQSLGRVLEGSSQLPKGYTIQNMVNGNLIETIKFSLYDEVFGPTISWIFKLGNIVSFILGVVFLINIVKYLLMTMLHCKILFQTFGFSIKLFTAFFSGLFHLVMNDWYKKENTVKSARHNHEMLEINVEDNCDDFEDIKNIKSVNVDLTRWNSVMRQEKNIMGNDCEV